MIKLNSFKWTFSDSIECVRICLMLLFFIGICKVSGSAQSGVSAVYSPAKVIKHNDNLLFDVPSRSHEFRLSYTYQTTGSQEWEQYWRKPRIAVNAMWVRFGDDSVLGSAFAVLPELHFTLYRHNKFKINMQFGTGVAYLNRPFDPVNNPKNNAIGSHFNNTSSIKFGLEYKWSDHILTTISGGLVHFSNGLSSSPNSGINIFGVSFGVNYLHNAKKTETHNPLIETRNDEEIVIGFRRWVADVQYHYGFTEHSTPGGPQFGVQAASIAAGYRYNRFMTVFLGGEYEYNNGVYVFWKRNFSTEEEAKMRAKKTIIYLENELRFGPVFNRFRLGFYVGWPAENTKNSYVKIMTGIYLPTIKNVAKPYVAVVLKTHVAVADYLAIAGGVTF